MLKALQLVGFKSFADKTRFEFPAGITVVVGPNGSGKSNIVDAIKWVLGEQSAKSLRGQDMSDVIFKGGGTSGRKPMNMAEATIIIDNSERRLPVDAPEVHVSRRVYRSGEGEYLINGQACRLKDVRDMFRGTGVGTDAYSLIEQGKVDRLLQASAKDRRAIFEEAAGISRFKAKKIEAQRRLERVEQNLLRLSDIVEEVENRLRNVNNQATKARRYREYSDRLQQLRTQVASTDWRHLSEKLEVLESQLAAVRDEAAQLFARTEAEEARQLELETEAVEAGETIRHCENRFARHREQILARESARRHETTRIAEMEQAAARHRRQLAAMNNRAGNLQQQLAETRSLLERADADYQRVADQVDRHEQAQEQLNDELARCRETREQRRQQYLEETRITASLGNQVVNLAEQAEQAEQAAEQARQRLTDLSDELTEQLREFEDLRATEQDLIGQVEENAEQLASAKTDLDENQRLVAQRKEELALQLGRLNGVQERASLLEEWQRNREGLNAGVQELLAQAADSDDGPLSDVRGVLADLINVDVELAPSVDAALGERTQYLVIRGDQLWSDAQQGIVKLSGRVGLLRIESSSMGLPAKPGPNTEPGPDLTDHRGVLGRADRMVQCRPEFLPVVQRLLDTTWLVDDLATAFSLAPRNSGQRFVTTVGEVLEPDGTLVVGPRGRSEGLISRRSELRALGQQLEVLEQQIEEAQREIQRLGENADRQSLAVRQLSEINQHLASELAEQRVATRTVQQRCEQLEKLRSATDTEARAAWERVEGLSQERDRRRVELRQRESSIEQLRLETAADEERLGEIEQKQQEQGREVTTARVELAKSEQQVDTLRVRMRQFEDDREERARTIRDARAQLQECVERRIDSERAVLNATSELAELYLHREAAADETVGHLERRRELNRLRDAGSERLQALRRQTQRIQQDQHKIELEAGQLQHERVTLADRLRDDYGIEIGELDEDVSPEEQHQREEVEQEIALLRRKIGNIGAVNMEALEELGELETRFASLSSQYEDLDQAKQALGRIIQKINADSRRLFMETLEAIRGNFQNLYRKAFGGGHADIVLEKDVDILECGIEIIATPPGKPSFNNSLLSGGEKALTAVALLLAIFQFRPSPFCVLDEVDAPFDEANIGRFVEVLKDFLGWTKFVIVTHSKKTMTSATTLYGVTMQESGVSKKVSVRFEDISEDGHISEDALRRHDDADTTSDEPDTASDERGAA